MPAKKQFDLIAIGESLRDVFYMIDEATVQCQLHKEHCLLCLEYAEKIPVKEVIKVPAAGNSSNAAVSAARLGLKTALVSWVGNDRNGEHIREALRREKVDYRYLITDFKHQTNESTILNYQGEKTQLLCFQPRVYSFPKLATTRGMYYSAMGDKTAAFDRALGKELKRNADIFFAFQPGTTHIRQGLMLLKPLIARSDLFILNKEEAHRLLEDGDRTLLNVLETFHRMGAKMVVVTDGHNGADAFDGHDHWHMPIFDGKVVERTGAGDSFASSMTAALLKGEALSEALRWGAANSWSVVQQVGPQAGLLSTAVMQRVLKKFSKVKPTLVI